MRSESHRGEGLGDPNCHLAIRQHGCLLRGGECEAGYTKGQGPGRKLQPIKDVARCTASGARLAIYGKCGASGYHSVLRY